MLVLGRRPGERVIITVGLTRIEVVLVDVDRNQVRLGFEAGETVIIKRAELLEAEGRARDPRPE